MRLMAVKDYRNAVPILSAEGSLDQWARDIFNVEQIDFKKGNLARLHEHIDNELTNAGWSAEFNLHPEYQLTIRSLRKRIAFHMQISGNASRMAYDLLKLQYLNSTGRIDAAIYALPVRECARSLGENIASYERAAGELDLFSGFISCPIMLIGYSN